MMRGTLLFFIIVVIGSTFALPNYVGAICFCNMDMAGGEEGKEAQKKSALAAALFFEATSITFQMFAQIEVYFTGKKDALVRAAELSKQSKERLGRAMEEFDGVRVHTKAIKAIDKNLMQLQDFSAAFIEAKVHPNSPIAALVIEALKKEGTVGMLGMCSQSIKDLQDPNKPMGKVYSTIEDGKPPMAPDLWSAIAQWNETLIKGRLISSIFTVRKK